MNREKKIIHIATDEKFIDSANFLFEQAFPGVNDFYIIVDDEEKKTKYVTLKENVKLVNSDINNLNTFINQLKGETIVIFHSMFYVNSYVTNRLDKDVKIFWFLFGAEFYGNQKLFKSSEFLGALTRKIFEKDTNYSWIKEVIKKNFRNFYYKTFKGIYSPYAEMLNAMNRSNVLGILYKEEYNNIINKLGVNKKLHLDFTYYPIERMISNMEDRVVGCNILIGNSASYTNNHLEVFEKLTTLNLKDSKIICPLSYGNNNYRNQIKKIGEEKFGENFQALIDFMPLKSYNEYIKSCNIVLMNHYRQQAVGNVMTMLWMGAKVFLDERNTLFHYLKRLGVTVFSINRDLNESKDLKPLSINEQNINRKLLLSELGTKSIVYKIENFLNPFLNKQ